MTLGCVKNVSSLRERNSSQGSFLFLLPRSIRFEGIFYARRRAEARQPLLRSGVHGLVVAVAGFNKILNQVLKKLLHKISNLLS